MWNRMFYLKVSHINNFIFRKKAYFIFSLKYFIYMYPNSVHNINTNRYILFLKGEIRLCSSYWNLSVRNPSEWLFVLKVADPWSRWTGLNLPLKAVCLKHAPLYTKRPSKIRKKTIYIFIFCSQTASVDRSFSLPGGLDKKLVVGGGASGLTELHLPSCNRDFLHKGWNCSSLFLFILTQF